MAFAHTTSSTNARIAWPASNASFYVPKQSARAQALEAKGNLARMLQEIPLLDEERAAVEDGVEAMTKLANGLRDIAAPDGRTPTRDRRFAEGRCIAPQRRWRTVLTRSLC